MIILRLFSKKDEDKDKEQKKKALKKGLTVGGVGLAAAESTRLLDSHDKKTTEKEINKIKKDYNKLREEAVDAVNKANTKAEINTDSSKTSKAVGKMLDDLGIKREETHPFIEKEEKKLLKDQKNKTKKLLDEHLGQLNELEKKSISNQKELLKSQLKANKALRRTGALGAVGLGAAVYLDNKNKNKGNKK
jgi:hypothetical protein